MTDFILKMVRELLKPRSLFAFMFYGTYCGLVLSKVNPPEHLTNIVLLILGFYFGNKSKGDER